jgi:REP element-mobilizing transposase RayT
MRENQLQPPFVLEREQRKAVEDAIAEVCGFRGYNLYAVNPRSNHAHMVVSAQLKPEHIANAFKSYATRKLRERGLVSIDRKIWARGRSRRYLWRSSHVDAAIDYVLYCQGDEEFERWYAARFDD